MLDLAKLVRFSELSAQIKELTQELDAIKAELRNSVGIGTTKLEGYEVTKQERFRVDLDKEKILLEIGADKLKDCEKISSYEVLLVKKI